MDKEPGSLFYAKQGDTWIIKLNGDVRYTMGCALRDFLDRLFVRDDYRAILVDLTDAQAIDSTMLGLLARIANFSQQRFQRPTTLLSTHPDINQILDNLGLSEIFTIRATHDAIAATLRPLAIPEPCDKAALSRVVYEAHQALSALNPTNQANFESVLASLRPKLEP